MKIILALLLVSLIGCATSHTVSQTVNRPVISEPTPWSVIYKSQEFKQLNLAQQEAFMDTWVSQWYNYNYGNSLSGQSEARIKYEIRNEIIKYGIREEAEKTNKQACKKPVLENDLGLKKPVLENDLGLKKPVLENDLGLKNKPGINHQEIAILPNPLLEDEIRAIVRKTHRECNYNSAYIPTPAYNTYIPDIYDTYTPRTYNNPPSPRERITIYDADRGGYQGFISYDSKMNSGYIYNIDRGYDGSFLGY